ncbi:MAG: cytochrome c [Oligoflexia bacterium]|nr:cytochrome c [Bdellovibrionales bacterium]MYE07683.1 cytochrome c [Oligoflexia bacterium]
MSIVRLSIVLSFIFIHPVLFAKGNAKLGKQKSVTCVACHGANGISNSPIWPNLAGQKAQYLVKQLKDFRSGARKEPSMSPMVKPLTDADIENLAAYYSSLKCK